MINQSTPSFDNKNPKFTDFFYILFSKKTSLINFTTYYDIKRKLYTTQAHFVTTFLSHTIMYIMPQSPLLFPFVEYDASMKV